MGKSVPENWEALTTIIDENNAENRLYRKGVMVSYIGSSYKWAKYDLLNRAAYDVNSLGEWPAKESDTYVIGIGDYGLCHILSGGYPFRSICGNDDVDRFITQAAVWWYLSDKGIGNLSNCFKESSSDPYFLRPEIKKLVEDAHTASIRKGTPTFEFEKVDGTTELLVPCLFGIRGTDDGGCDIPRVVSLNNPASLVQNYNFSTPDIPNSSMKDPAAKFSLESGQYRMFSPEGEFTTHVIFGGVGLSNDEIIDFVNKKRATEEIPLGNELHFTVAPSAPTPEMKAAGISVRYGKIMSGSLSAWHY